MDQDIPFERIGGYRIVRRLATGGTSDVLLARAEGPHGFERTVVLKLLLQQFRRDAPMEKMFAREAAAYARLSHPAIVKLYDFFSAEGQLVMVLEYIDGLPLNRFRAMLRKNGEQVDDRASIFIASRVFASLAAAHGARDSESGEFAPVIHRDVNPSNILIPWDGHVKLADFGIAKVAGVSSDTQAGFIKGTYGYMAPEQVRGDPVTVRTDVYAASLLLWELLARRKAIQRGALPEVEVLRAMAEPSLPSLDVLRPDLPQRLRDAIARGLEPSPDARSVTAEEMLIVLRESVTSNEGRNVLADTLARVRPDSEGSRSAAPPAVEAISADATVKVPAQPASPGVAPRAPSDSSIEDRPRAPLAPGPGPGATGAGASGQATAGQAAAGQAGATISSGGVILGRVVPPPGRGAPPRPAGPGIRPLATLGLGVLREESLGAYSAVATSGRPLSEEKTSATATRMGLSAPGSRPPGPAAPLTPRSPMAPIPIAALATPVASTGGNGGVGSDSLAPVLGGGRAGGELAATPPASPPLVGQPVVNVSDVPPSLAGPFSAPGVPPPPAAIMAMGPELAAGPSTVRLPPSTPPSGPPPPAPTAFLSPAQQAAPFAATVQAQAPVQPIAAMLASTLPLLRPGPSEPPRVFPTPPPRALTPLPLPTGTRAGTGAMYLYLAIAGMALLASAMVVGAVIYSRRPSTSDKAVATRTASATANAGEIATATATAAPSATTTTGVTVTARPTATPTPTLTPTPTATATPTPTATPTATASATPTATPTPSAPPAPTPTPTDTSPAPVPPTSSTDGQIITPPAAGGHRIFVDGRYAGDSPGPVNVHCGQHSVKVGSNGVPHTVTVPCGGEISVSPR